MLPPGVVAGYGNQLASRSFLGMRLFVTALQRPNRPIPANQLSDGPKGRNRIDHQRHSRSWQLAGWQG